MPECFSAHKLLGTSPALPHAVAPFSLFPPPHVSLPLRHSDSHQDATSTYKTAHAKAQRRHDERKRRHTTQRTERTDQLEEHTNQNKTTSKPKTAHTSTNSNEHMQAQATRLRLEDQQQQHTLRTLMEKSYGSSFTSEQTEAVLRAFRNDIWGNSTTQLSCAVCDRLTGAADI